MRTNQLRETRTEKERKRKSGKSIEESQQKGIENDPFYSKGGEAAE